uniref:Uncharacterized protein n=1 Tax=Panagrolaimus sp. JU765 TaxID=591449 RepID=A0AC34Q594_9BILA
MYSDRFSLNVDGFILFDDSGFPVLKQEFVTTSISKPDVNLKRKYSRNCIPFSLKDKLPIISYIQSCFLPRTDLETATWDARFVTHRAALSAMTSSCFKLFIEVFQERIFIRICEIENASRPKQTLEQKNLSAYSVAFLTDSDGQPDWRNYVLRRMKIGQHKVYFNALVDAKKKDGNLVEIRSRGGSKMSYLSAVKLLLENYLTGIECSVIGYHDPTGKMTTVEHFSTNDSLSRKYNLKKETLQIEIEMMDKILTEIDLFVETNPEITKFNVVKFSERAGLKFIPNEEHELLSDSFKERFESL